MKNRALVGQVTENNKRGIPRAAGEGGRGINVVFWDFINSHMDDKIYLSLCELPRKQHEYKLYFLIHDLSIWLLY